MLDLTLLLKYYDTYWGKDVTLALHVAPTPLFPSRLREALDRDVTVSSMCYERPSFLEPQSTCDFCSINRLSQLLSTHFTECS